MRGIILGAAAVVVTGLYLHNASWPADPDNEFAVLAHRGVHQTYPSEGLTRDACTATRIHPPTHAFIENTLPSMREAFRLGADVVEIDIHPTTDGEFAVFHDWTLDCRTNGQGVTREQTMAYLKTLDAGYGYTADGGRTYPLRGTGVGAIPTLAEVLEAFPDRRFQINIKSNDPSETDRLAAYFLARPHLRAERVSFFGGDRPIRRLREVEPRLAAASKGQMKACLKDYMLTGWTGHVPESCQGTVLMAPEGIRTILWGWPDRFLERMQRAGTEVWAVGGIKRQVQSVEGIDTPEAVARLPRCWRGGVQTDRIEVVAEALAEHRRRLADCR
ncbi:glycerophosphodiester phosphodiesterase family protein [Brevundimonas sp. 2R-24]|uniref:Glycerophosphodiester phosphodiesterase family protein n=1 Tax=Peiella sedimenti TaxID=3061083 RepID=A0ABT8SHX8_9CAUL|nr:glycerophosphodiester phosphodiesterase family protein [Caulobacteraceae bacterium XZ-24]